MFVSDYTCSVSSVTSDKVQGLIKIVVGFREKFFQWVDSWGTVVTLLIDGIFPKYDCSESRRKSFIEFKLMDRRCYPILLHKTEALNLDLDINYPKVEIHGRIYNAKTEV